MNCYETLVSALKANAENDIQRRIVFINGEDNEVDVTYKTLYERALYILYNLQALGIEPGNEVVLLLDENEELLYTFWACLLGGIIPVPLAVGNNDEHKMKLFRVWSVLNKPYLVTTQKIFSNLEKFTEKNNLEYSLSKFNNNIAYFDDIKVTKISGSIHDVSKDDIAFIQFSSGSTGDPKGVVLTHENIIANICAIINCSGLNSRDIMLSWMPLTHDMGMIGMHLTPLILNSDQYIMPTSLFVRRPILWFKKINQTRATIISSPNFGYNYFLSYLNQETASEWELSCVRRIFNGAEPINAELCKRFMNEMEKYGLNIHSMFTVYGMAEASLAVTFPIPEEELKYVVLDRKSINTGDKIKEIDENSTDGVIFVDVGFPVDNCQVRICNDEDAVIEDSIIGNIHIKGKNVTKGYYNNYTATQKSITEDGWLKTGDLGFIRNGRLIITGRAKDIIFVNGQNFYPYDIERVIEENSSIELGKVAVCGVSNPRTQTEDILVFILHKKSIDDFVPVALDIRKTVQKLLGLTPMDIIPIKSIPKTTSGKVQRYKLGEAYQSGEYDEVINSIRKNMDSLNAAKTEEEPKNPIEVQLFEICCNVLGTGSIRINDNLFEIGVSSLLLGQITEQVEALFPGKVTVTDFFKYPTISKMARFIGGEGMTSLPSINMPSSYFREIYGTDTVNSLRFSIDQEKYDSIKNLSEHEGIGIYDILLSIFIYLLFKASGQDILTVQTMLEEDNKVRSLNINIKEATDLLHLIKITSKAVRGKELDSYLLTDFDSVVLQKGENSFIPFFYAKEYMNINTDLLGVYDIVLEANCESERIGFRLDYIRCLNIEKMKDLANGYIKLVKILSDQYNVVNNDNSGVKK